MLWSVLPCFTTLQNHHFNECFKEAVLKNSDYNQEDIYSYSLLFLYLFLAIEKTRHSLSWLQIRFRGREEAWVKYFFSKWLVFRDCKICQLSQFNIKQISELRYYIHFQLSCCEQELCTVSDNTGGSVWEGTQKDPFEMTAVVLHLLYLRYFQNRAVACKEVTHRRVCVLEGLSFFFFFFPNYFWVYKRYSRLCNLSFQDRVAFKGNNFLDVVLLWMSRVVRRENSPSSL